MQSQINDLGALTAKHTQVLISLNKKYESVLARVEKLERSMAGVRDVVHDISLDTSADRQWEDMRGEMSKVMFAQQGIKPKSKSGEEILRSFKDAPTRYSGGKVRQGQYTGFDEDDGLGNFDDQFLRMHMRDPRLRDE